MLEGVSKRPLGRIKRLRVLYAGTPRIFGGGDHGEYPLGETRGEHRTGRRGPRTVTLRNLTRKSFSEITQISEAWPPAGPRAGGTRGFERGRRKGAELFRRGCQNLTVCGLRERQGYAQGYVGRRGRSQAAWKGKIFTASGHKGNGESGWGDYRLSEARNGSFIGLISRFVRSGWDFLWGAKSPGKISYERAQGAFGCGTSPFIGIRELLERFGQGSPAVFLGLAKSGHKPRFFPPSVFLGCSASSFVNPGLVHRHVVFRTPARFFRGTGFVGRPAVLLARGRFPNVGRLPLVPLLMAGFQSSNFDQGGISENRGVFVRARHFFGRRGGADGGGLSRGALFYPRALMGFAGFMCLFADVWKGGGMEGERPLTWFRFARLGIVAVSFQDESRIWRGVFWGGAGGAVDLGAPICASVGGSFFRTSEAGRLLRSRARRFS